jgi:outer membrane lipoprotein SlyB
MDNTQHSTRKLHPLVATAAGAVVVASLAATAAITGVFPKASSSSAQTDQAQTALVASQPVVDSAAPAAVNAQQQARVAAPAAVTAQQQAGAGPAPSYAQPSQSYAQPSQSYAQPSQSYAQNGTGIPAQSQYAPPSQPRAAACTSCGTVESIVAVRREGHTTGIGAVGGAVAGGVIGNQFGGGGGRTAMTLLGALGGGLGGNAIEKHMRSETDYQVRVRMEAGKLRYFTYRQVPPFQNGERVRISNGTLVHAG